VPTDHTCEAILGRLESLGDPKNVEGMARYGIRTAKAYGVSTPDIRRLAKEIGKDHKLALALWRTGVHDARGLAALIDDPAKVTTRQMERWVRDFDTWAICDCTCGFLFDKTPYAWDKAIEWTARDEEYVKRAGFVLMAALVVHDKKAPSERFEAFFPSIIEHATDERNFVKKAVNWALRQIGKRDRRLNGLAVKTAEQIRKIDSKAARWIAADALRELTSDKVRQRLKRQPPPAHHQV
jgi:3-methyladenine DNA glycosylase AlkD